MLTTRRTVSWRSLATTRTTSVPSCRLSSTSGLPLTSMHVWHIRRSRVLAVVKILTTPMHLIQQWLRLSPSLLCRSWKLQMKTRTTHLLPAVHQWNVWKVLTNCRHVSSRTIMQPLHGNHSRIGLPKPSLVMAGNTMTQTRHG